MREELYVPIRSSLSNFRTLVAFLPCHDLLMIFFRRRPVLKNLGGFFPSARLKQPCRHSRRIRLSPRTTSTICLLTSAIALLRLADPTGILAAMAVPASGFLTVPVSLEWRFTLGERWRSTSTLWFWQRVFTPACGSAFLWRMRLGIRPRRMAVRFWPSSAGRSSVTSKNRSARARNAGAINLPGLALYRHIAAVNQCNGEVVTL